jgi:hypothetical protein
MIIVGTRRCLLRILCPAGKNILFLQDLVSYRMGQCKNTIQVGQEKLPIPNL